jgi:hypothetical protein
MKSPWQDPRIAAAVGLLTGLFANKITEYLARFRSYLLARKLKGKWTAHNMLDGRHVDRQKPMPGAGLTEIKPRPWWRACSSDSHVLDVYGEDTSDGRRHSGPLVIDPLCSRFASRMVLYSAPSDEISEQRIVIGPDLKTLYVFPISAVATMGPVYRVHALCKHEGRT